MTFLLSASMIRRLVTMNDVIDAVGQAARERAAGALLAAPRVALPGGKTLLMAGESAERDGVATKVVSVAPANRACGLATIQGLASWLDYATRRPLLIADATAATALRTGALAGVATKALAPPGASVLAMVGTGGMATSLVEACAAVLDRQGQAATARALTYVKSHADATILQGVEPLGAQPVVLGEAGGIALERGIQCQHTMF